jgi:hypothetical protein
VFDWFNYLYACGICNGRKGNHWCILANGTRHTLRRTNAERQAKTYAPPLQGDPLFINPREEDPMEFLRVDLLGTFEITARSKLAEHAKRRANWTIEKLELNLREDLVDARTNHYRMYIDRLKQHIIDRDHGESLDALGLRIEGIRRMDHPMVWREMCRSHTKIAELTPLFETAPEALHW